MKSLPIFLAVSLFAMSAFAGISDQVTLVKISDRTKKISYEIKTSDEVKELDKECRDEKRAWSKAVSLASREWRKMAGTGSKTFPRSCAYPKTYKKVGRPFKNVEDAEMKKNMYVDLQKADGCCGCGKKGKKKGGSGGPPPPKRSEKSKKKKEAMDKSKAAREEATLTKARNLLEEKLQEVLNPPEKTSDASDDASE